MMKGANASLNVNRAPSEATSSAWGRSLRWNLESEHTFSWCKKDRKDVKRRENRKRKGKEAEKPCKSKCDKVIAHQNL